MSPEKLTRVAICDDSREDIILIEEAIKSCMERDFPEETMEFRSFLSGNGFAMDEWSRLADLVFMDIEMETADGKDGFALAREISWQKGPKLIFVSQYENFIWTSQKFMPLYFVRKSKLSEDIKDALWQYKRIVNAESKIAIKNVNLNVEDMVYLECVGHTVTTHLTNGRLMKQYGSLKSMEQKLKGSVFLRIHKNYLVNMRFVEEVLPREVRLKGGVLLEMGRDRRKHIVKALYEGRDRNVFRGR